MRRSVRIFAVAVAAGSAVLLGGGADAGADPYRLRANVFADSHTQMQAGTLTLSADGKVRSWMAAEAVVWLGAGSEQEADAMVIMVDILDPKHRGQLRLGRFLVSGGALRPVHLDGARGRARLPWNFSLEAFGGLQVQPKFGAGSGDWITGGRISHLIGDWGAFGAGYMQRQDGGQLAGEEVGGDLCYAPTRWLDLAGRVAYDLNNPGISTAHVSIALRRGSLRGELFGSHLSPSRLLPATSLFSVLGDGAPQRYGLTTRWHAAPRLDILTTTAARSLDDELGYELRGKATLRLDERGKRVSSLELHRQDIAEAAWSGVRGALRLPWTGGTVVVAELELVVPDEPAGRGSLWAWSMLAIGWEPIEAWHVAAAVEASSSPQYTSRVDGMLRLSREWGAL